MERFFSSLKPALLACGIAFVSISSALAQARAIRGLASVRETPVTPLTFENPTGPTAMGHSHNDFAQEHPLDTALEEGYSSIEVDVTDSGGDVSVVHLGLWTFGTLKTMYLDRLQRLVDEKGSVYGDGKKVTLWIELRPFITTAAIVPLLNKLLNAYPMFAIFGKSGKVVRPGPVEAVVINQRAREYFANRDTAPACLGTGHVDFSDEPNEPFECWHHLHWSSYFDWDGNGEMPAEEVSLLKKIQANAHARGLRTRFWDTPDTPEFWRRVRGLPFDILNTDHLRVTMEVLRGVMVP